VVEVPVISFHVVPPPPPAPLVPEDPAPLVPALPLVPVVPLLPLVPLVPLLPPPTIKDASIHVPLPEVFMFCDVVFPVKAVSSI